MERRLIKKVGEYDLLYRTDSSYYRDKQMRASAWSEISQALGVPASECKEKWRKLRNCYLNAVNRRQNKQNIAKWRYETEMSFLRPYIEVRAPQQLALSEPSNQYNSGYNDSASEEMNDFEVLSPRCDSPEVILPETSNMVMPYKRKSSEEEEDLTQDLPSSSRKRIDSKKFDETEMFFLSMSQTVKRLKPVDQARVKKQLCNLVYEAEIKLLEEAEELEVS